MPPELPTLSWMAHSQLIPVQLRRGPFTLGDARIAGLSRHTLASKSWKHLGTELYCWNGARENQSELISAWGRLLPPNAVFAGSTAAWLLGLDVEPARPVEVILPNPSAVHSRVGLKVHRCQLQDFDVVEVRGLQSTSIQRTLLDLCCRQSDVEALVTIDMAVSGNLTTVPALVRYASDARGRPGVRRLRSLAPLGAKAESPMETRLRWLLLRAGLPTPEVQTDLRDADGRLIGRADLYYPAARLVVEYDGANHRERLVEDNRRQNLLMDAGYALLRFTAADINRQPEVVETLVRRALVKAALGA